MASARPLPRGARTAAALLAAVGLLVAGCSVGPSQRPPVAVRGDTRAVPPAPDAAAPAPPDALPDPQQQRPTIPFVDCTTDTISTLRTPPPADRSLHMDCGELTVAADPTSPTSQGLTLSVLRVSPTGAPADRPPLLVVGDSAGESTARAAVLLALQVAPALLEQYTLVGLDRRGAGAAALNCSPDDARAALVDADPSATSEKDLTSLLESARDVVQECNIALDGDIGTYRTAATAADIEPLRTALGVRTLSAIGFGDGAGALSSWARTSPQAVGRLVLDGPQQPGLDQPDLGEAQAKAAEAAFSAFAVSCATKPDCALGPDPRAAVMALVTALRSHPIAAPDGRRLTSGGALLAVLWNLGEPTGWPALATALATARAGDPTPLLNSVDPVIGPHGRYDEMLATACNDTRSRLSPGQISTIAGHWRDAYPMFGATMALQLLDCAPWPTGGPVLAGGTAVGAPPLLVIGGAADPRAPMDGARRTADGLATAKFLSWQGAGSGAYPRTACVTGVVDAMLVQGVVPQSGTLCPP
ncbi:alpha/beta hydrolase [Pseudonocardia sp. GCM10023141]|uniref:alpha/beta hydrolase n=1 Tax=Pseudonocardia sp. GCM10023141 TaxID=3252653 RepID=UPI0036211C5B